MELWEALTRRTGHGRLRAWTGSGFAEMTWGEVATEAAGVAAGLRRAGVHPGRTVAALLTNTPAAVPGLLGIWLAGGTVASLPVPAPGMDRRAYARDVADLVGRLDAPLILADERLLDLLPAVPRSRSWQSLRGDGGGWTGREPPGDDEPAYIQFSSGSTSAPKGCVLTARAIAAQLELIVDFTGGRPGHEVVSSWLPLSHDMGMFGCLLVSWAYDYHLVLSSPERFTLGPRTWFGDMAEHGVTMTAGTNTALYLATRMQRSAPLPGPLRLRTCIVGAERVDVTTLQQAVRTFGPHGLAADVMRPAYGLAEATLAVTACRARAPAVVTVDGLALAGGELADVAPDDPVAVPVVSTGPPCRGVTVDVEEPGRLSPIRVSSPSLASGYFADEERTRATFTPDGLRTGDLGFLRDGELYVVGRGDDVLTVAGRNVHAHEIEARIDDHPAVRKGCVVLLDVPADGYRELVVLAELRRRDADHRAFAEQAARVVLTRAGVTLDRCVFVPKGTLPKTPSGKIQRFRCRQLLHQHALEPLAHVVLSD
ncbi:AMP-binding enzyme [Micromonospora sp. KC207]|uniref:AMP-binding protein n=1 Tax=Micromonospora sp. KC207 TaxID=2530377 RepID=UPI00104CD565|nr:AMP-binding protein [Micromonospora sp. KC207]TDC65374.1 AMP-binding enzyme [Micromonospora sp. KC207]